MQRGKRLGTFTVHAGWHERRWCPVESEIEIPAMANGVLWDRTDGRAVPVQVWAKGDGLLGAAWIVAHLVQGEVRNYDLYGAQDGSVLTDGVQVQEAAAGKLEVTVSGRPFTTYNYEDVVRPYLYPIWADEGVGITRNWPMVEGVPGETNDHPHHRGLYTAQGEVNGVDNWSQVPGHGWQIHRAFTRVYGGPVAGGWSEELDWTDAERVTNMTETRRLTFYCTPTRGRLLDYSVTLHASQGEVTLGDTKEAGLLSVRVASSMDAEREGGGRIENGAGGVQEEETWGRRAPWCDYSGPIGDRWYGICLMDHEDNPRHPTHWHVRNYGLMTANCFGLHHFTGDAERRWDLVIPAGASLTWRYRALIHHGDAAAAQAGARYQDFVHPPAVEFHRL